MSRKLRLALFGAVALALAAQARAEDKPAFYDAASTYSQGNSKATTGAGLQIDTRGKEVSLYIKGVAASADMIVRVQCSAIGGTDDDDWGTCSADYTVAGETLIALSVCDSNFERLYVTTATAGAVTATWTLESR